MQFIPIIFAIINKINVKILSIFVYFYLYRLCATSTRVERGPICTLQPAGSTAKPPGIPPGR